MAQRRSHQKSRHGCLECKRRRVKVHLSRVSLSPLGSPPPLAIPILVAFPHSMLSLSATNLDQSVPIVLDDRPIASMIRLGLCDG